MTAPPSAPLGLDITPEPVVALPPPRPRPSRRLVVLVAGALALVVAAVVAVVALRPPPHSDEPVVLPGTLLGLAQAPAPFDFGADPIWQQAQGNTGVQGAVGGRAYSPGDPIVPQVNLVVTRQDVSGDDEPGDIGMAGEVEQRFGEVSCTQQMDYSNWDASPTEIERPAPGRSDSLLICWRSVPTLTVSVLVMGIGRASFTSADVAAAVDEVWALQG